MSDFETRFGGIARLYGQSGLQKLRAARVGVIGIGGVGVGIRVIVPFIQMVRLDLAFGQNAQGLVPHFGIREKAFYHRRRVR